MNIRIQQIVKATAATVAVSAGLVAAALPARAEPIAFGKLALIDFRPNLKVHSALSDAFPHPITGDLVRTFSYLIENTGLTSAPATTAGVTIEVGDPFSPISTAISLKTSPTPALSPGHTTAWYVLLIPEDVYFKVDVRADFYNVVNERTENDNHRVHSVGYVP